MITHTDEDIEARFGKLPIRYLVFVCDDFIVFVDQQLDVDWYTTKEYDTNYPADQKAQNDILNLAATVETTPCQYLDEPTRLGFKRLVAEGIARALQEDYANARSTLERAETFVMLRSQEMSRHWYLKASALTGLGMAVAAVALWLVRSPLIGVLGLVAFYALLACTAGAMGAMLSIIMRMGKLHLDCLSGKTLHYMEGVSRIAAGSLSGLLVYLAIESGQLLPALLAADSHHTAVLFAAMVAGASERWAPSIVSHFEGTAQRAPDKSK